MKQDNKQPDPELICKTITSQNASMILKDDNLRVDPFLHSSGWKSMVSDFRPYRFGKPANRLAIIRWILYLDTLINTAFEKKWLTADSIPKVVDSLNNYCVTAISELLDQSAKHGSRPSTVLIEIRVGLEKLEIHEFVRDAVTYALNTKGDSDVKS